jgi:large subunit ribosomal protein L6
MIPTKFSFVRIPYHISVFFMKRKNLLIFKYGKEIRFLSIDEKFSFLFTENKIFVIVDVGNEFSNIEKRKLSRKKNELLSWINLFLVEIENKIYHKLKISGIGYKVLELEELSNKILFFRLGFSHYVYFKVSKNIFVFCSKSVEIFVKGKSFYNVKRTSAEIKSLKKPEPYKGKGISYYNEIKKLKPGKRV